MGREQVTTNLHYIRKHFATQDALLERIGQALPGDFASWQIAPEEGRLLQLLIAMNGVRRVVEIGALAGYSAIWMARALPGDGHIFTLGKDPAHNALAKQFIAQSEVASRITLVEGDAHETLPALGGQGPFDMVFIDADKISYPDYLDWAETHVRQGGLIVGDNTFLFDTIGLDAPPEGTAPATWKAMRQFNERLADKKRYFSTIIPTAEGLTVAIKQF